MDELLDKPLKENEVVKSSIEIKYRLPKFFHRVLANLIDLLLVALIFICAFLACRAVILNSSKYQSAQQIVANQQLASGLYKEKNGTITDLMTYIDDGGFTAKGKAQEAVKGIVQVSNHVRPYMNDKVNSEKEQTYRNYFLAADMSFTDGGVTYPYVSKLEFTIVDGKYTTVIELTVHENYPWLNAYNNCFKPFLKDHCFAIFQNYDTDYKSNLLTINNMFVFIAVPISYVLAGLLVYFVPPLFFKRGRQTLGKALYKIGLVNKKCYIPSFKMWLLRFGIFFIGIYLLSIVTFGIPMIVSFTMMCCTKKKQNFTDYMLNFAEVDVSSNKIYFNQHEIYLSLIRGEKDPINFKMKDLN